MKVNRTVWKLSVCYSFLTRINQLSFYLAQQSNSALDRVIVEVSRSRTRARARTHSVCLSLSVFLYPLKDWSARTTGRYLHNKHKRRTSMPSAGLEPAIPAYEWPQKTCALDHIWVRKKVKWSRYRPGVAQRVGRCIALLFHDRGTRKGWVVSSTPQQHFTSGKDPVPILQKAGCAPGPVWMGGKSRPHRDSIPDRPARSQSLYRWATRPTTSWIRHVKFGTGVDGKHIYNHAAVLLVGQRLQPSWRNS